MPHRLPPPQPEAAPPPPPDLVYPGGSAIYYFHRNVHDVVRIMERALEKIADGHRDEWFTRVAREALTDAAIAANRRS